MPTHDPQFIRACFRLVLTMWELNLPTPLHIGWEAYPQSVPRLRVQVDSEHFRDWALALRPTEHYVEVVERNHHVHVVGHLAVGDDYTAVHLLSVMDTMPDIDLVAR